MHRQVSRLRQMVLGNEHPSILTSIANLTLVYWNQGRWDEAVNLGRPVVKMRKIALGHRHRHTLVMLSTVEMPSILEPPPILKMPSTLEMSPILEMPSILETLSPLEMLSTVEMFSILDGSESS
jgi:hypothetical protein